MTATWFLIVFISVNNYSGKPSGGVATVPMASKDACHYAADLVKIGKDGYVDAICVPTDGGK